MRTTQKGSVAIGVAVAVLAIAFTVWYVFFKAESKPVPEAPAPISTSTVITEEPSIDSAVIEKAIHDSPYRVIKIYNPPNAKFQVFIATERVPSGGEGCGSIYSSPTCYFFIEPKYIHEAPAARYIGKLVQPGLLEHESLEMKDDQYLYFTTWEADGGHGFTQDWQLDLKTSTFKKLKRTETQSEM